MGIEKRVFLSHRQDNLDIKTYIKLSVVSVV